MLKIPITILPWQRGPAAAGVSNAACGGDGPLRRGDESGRRSHPVTSCSSGAGSRWRCRTGSRHRSGRDPVSPHAPGITVVNSPGTIDPDYRGEVKVALVNLGRAAFSIERGMRIAQLLVAPVARVMWEKTETLSETARGAGGFGHTGQT